MGVTEWGKGKVGWMWHEEYLSKSSFVGLELAWSRNTAFCKNSTCIVHTLPLSTISRLLVTVDYGELSVYSPATKFVCSLSSRLEKIANRCSHPRTDAPLFSRWRKHICVFNFCLLLFAETGMREGVSFIYLHTWMSAPKFIACWSLSLLHVKYLLLVVVYAESHLFLPAHFVLQLRLTFVFLTLVAVFMLPLFIRIRCCLAAEFSGNRKQQCRT